MSVCPAPLLSEGRPYIQLGYFRQPINGRSTIGFSERRAIPLAGDGAAAKRVAARL
jgi:hypothetical protein